MNYKYLSVGFLLTMSLSSQAQLLPFLESCHSMAPEGVRLAKGKLETISSAECGNLSENISAQLSEGYEASFMMRMRIQTYPGFIVLATHRDSTGAIDGIDVLRFLSDGKSIEHKQTHHMTSTEKGVFTADLPKGVTLGVNTKDDNFIVTKGDLEVDTRVGETESGDDDRIVVAFYDYKLLGSSKLYYLTDPNERYKVLKQ